MTDEELIKKLRACATTPVPPYISDLMCDVCNRFRSVILRAETAEAALAAEQESNRSMNEQWRQAVEILSFLCPELPSGPEADLPNMVRKVIEKMFK